MRWKWIALGKSDQNDQIDRFEAGPSCLNCCRPPELSRIFVPLLRFFLQIEKAIIWGSYLKYRKSLACSLWSLGAGAGCRCKMSMAACVLVLVQLQGTAARCLWQLALWSLVLVPLQRAAARCLSAVLELACWSGCWCRCRVGCRKMSTAACTFEPTCLCRCRVRSLVLVPLQVPWGFTQRQHWLFSTRQNDMDKHKNVEQIKHIFSSSISQGCGGSFKDRKP